MSNEMMKREMQEAVQAGERALQSLYAARDKLGSARNWGIFDMLGGGFISDFVKHSKMNDAAALMEQAKSDIQRFQRELRDVQVSLDLRMEIGSFLSFADFFLDGLVAEAKEKGYVTTMFGRRRPVPELKSSNFMQRSFGERVAMNSPIQGTAADIIKIAMVRVNERLKKENLRSRLILQVHDELLVEAAVDEVEKVKHNLLEEMQGAADLDVCLEIDMHTGNNWYEAK